ncbi:MAG: polysaccharide deacetylase family protein [Dialister invisus]|uniref:polysaccharide deacetylase family protein n=1 Tax=Dialister invisus TaxID=218538 RepID=UPI001CADEF47|nr:polysaccharide deacetylase family protein [Dialister invisus]MBF1121293.1 polysaccharide deacetylase family protein [Dialister invisus]
MFLSHWKKSAAVFAALLGISGTVFLGGCGMWKSGVPKEDAVNMAEASSVKAKDPNFKPGTAIVHRDADVEYSVPEGVSILMYHMIGDMKNNSAVMTEDNLRIQMQYLKDHGYHPITMQELYDYVTKGEKLPSKPVCITFDDGYLDSYTIVYPMMKEFGYPWTLFLITDDVGKSYNRMTWEQLKEMADSGAVTIANHTLSHPKLHNLPTRAEKENEIIGANKALKYHLGIDNLWFAYPYGDYDDEVIDICKKAGIKLAVTTDAGRVHVGSYPYDLKRVYIGNNVSLARFMERLTKDNYAPL